MQRVPQPPINPALRDTEHHDFWTGVVILVIGVVFIFCGLRHVTGVETTDGGAAREAQLVTAFSSGGVKYASQIPPSAPPRVDDTSAAAEALDRWAKSRAVASVPTWKIRVDTEAKTPCPT